MPVGLAIMKWDEKVGAQIKAKYPENVELTEETLMHIISMHEYSGETGIINLMLGSLSISSYYTGSETSYYILLLLKLDEDPDAYEGGFLDSASLIRQNLEDDAYLTMIQSIFHRISVFPSLTKEQLLAMTYKDELKNMIINRLKSEGAISKSELSIWLRDVCTQGFVELDNVIKDLIKMEVIKESSVKGIGYEFIFLINDIFMCRIPSVKTNEYITERGLPEQLVSNFLRETKNLFQNYTPSEEDNLSILEILVDPQVYEVLRLLRTAVVTRTDIEKLEKKGVEDIERVTKILADNKMIYQYQDKSGTKYYALISDFYLKLIFPKHQLRVIKTVYENKSKGKPIILEYLNVLEDAYYAMKS